MKEKITYLILGILIGAVITSGCFLVFAKGRGPGDMDKQKPDFSNMTDEEREEMMKNRGEPGEFKKSDSANENKTTKTESDLADNDTVE